MSQWVILLVLALGAAAFLARPFLSRQTRAMASDSNAAAADTVQPPIRRIDWMTVAAVAAVVVAGATGLYVLVNESDTAVATATTGSPVQVAQPKLPDVDTMIARVAERLKADPKDAEDWRMLGWSYFETQRYTDAVDAYAHAVALQPESSAFQSAYGEALVLAANRKVTPDAMKAFRMALKGAPDDERALYYAGLAKSQAGNPNEAIADWSLALKKAPAGSVWVPRLRSEIAGAGKAANVDVSALLPPMPAPIAQDFARPPAEAVQQAQAMSPEDRQGMIKNMVAGLDERLARNPRDRDGWVRLIRSRKVLGETDSARVALDRALAAFADDPATQTDLKAVAMQIGVVASLR
jgi:cytochrome c-type biogenesis protein CcmH